jgi:hypothetical protein
MLCHRLTFVAVVHTNVESETVVPKFTLTLYLTEIYSFKSDCGGMFILNFYITRGLEVGGWSYQRAFQIRILRVAIFFHTKKVKNTK